MLFSTPVYPFFLVAVCLIYWAAPPSRRRDILSAASLLLLGYLSWRGTLVFLALTAYVYLLGRQLRQGQLTPRTRTLVLAAALSVPVGYLVAFKSFPNYVPPLRQMLASLSSDDLMLPLGISFFTFKFVHYVIECRRRTLAPHGFLDFLAFASLFTTFAAGPIERFNNLEPQFREPRYDAANLSRGLERILAGMVKKILVADLLVSWLVDQVGNVTVSPATHSAGSLYVWLWCRLLLIYFDFSGYSDIAVGTSLLFGLKVMENFENPLLRTNISEFWRSWHISLSSWCRDYVYFPVFGLTRNPKIGVYASMLVLGYWHGANIRWICWGAWHASGLAVWQMWQVRKRRLPDIRTIERTTLYRVTAWLLTVNFVALGAVWTGTSGPVDAIRFLYYFLIK